MIQLDLTTNVPEPLDVRGRQIALPDLKKLGLKMGAYLDIKRCPNKQSREDRQTLKVSADLLQKGNLSLLYREVHPLRGLIHKDKTLIKLAEETFGAGTIDCLHEMLAQMPDYDVKLLSGDAAYLRAVGEELQRLNLDYCTIRKPHLLPVGGLHTFAHIAKRLKDNELEVALRLRLQEGDKLRGKGDLTEYLQKTFGTGFRILDAFKRKNNQSEADRG